MLLIVQKGSVSIAALLKNLSEVKRCLDLGWIELDGPLECWNCFFQSAQLAVQEGLVEHDHDMVGLQGESVFEYSERYGGLPLLHREHTSQEQGVEKLGVFLENTVEAFARVGEIPGAVTRERGEEIMNEVDLVLGIDIRALGGRGTGVSQRLELRLRFRVDDPRNALGIPFLDEFSHASRTLRLALDEVPRLARVLAQIEDLRPRCTFTPSTPP